MKLKVKSNLHMIDDRVLSYDTEVAKIVGKEIMVYGKYSRTTSKHLRYLADETGFRLNQLTAKQQVYWQFAYGTNISFSQAVSPAGTAKILELLKEGHYSIEGACAQAWSEMSLRDRKIIAAEYDSEVFNLAAELGLGEILL
jgi:hypothetical protein